MPTKKPIIQVVVDEKTNNLLTEIAENENRSKSNLASFILKQYTEQYETSKNKELLISQNTGTGETKIG